MKLRKKRFCFFGGSLIGSFNLIARFRFFSIDIDSLFPLRLFSAVLNLGKLGTKQFSDRELLDLRFGTFAFPGPQPEPTASIFRTSSQGAFALSKTTISEASQKQGHKLHGGRVDRFLGTLPRVRMLFCILSVTALALN